MQLQSQNILFFTRTMQLGGTENVVLQLCEIFKPLTHKIIVCSSGGVNEEKLHELGIKHYSIPDVEDKSPRTIVRVARLVRLIVNNENITVIHTHHRMAAFYVRLMGMNKRCIFINTSHNTFSDKRMLTRFAYKKANLIACGEKVKQNLQDYFGLRNVSVIHNAVKAFDGRSVEDEQLRIAKANGKFLIGNIGRLSEQKGMEYYIRAIPTVIERHPEVQFFIIGSGEEEICLKKLAEEIHAPIIFMGYRSDIQNLMSQLDLIVLSSLWEGLPLTPIEAFSVGKTIVATAVDGTPEIVQNQVNGLLFEPKDYEQLAEKICWIIEHPDDRKRMEAAAKRTFENEFSFNRLRDSYVGFYQKFS